MTLKEKSSSVEGKKNPTILKVIQAKLVVDTYYLLTIDNNNDVYDGKYFKAHIANQAPVVKDR